MALIGAGQLGSRHLQALARLDHPGVVQVVEPDRSAAELARRRLAEAGPGRIAVEFVGSIAELQAGPEAVIVATTSAGREAVVAELLESKKPRFLVLEKFLFQTPAAYPRVAELLRRAGARAWVNCPRRQWPSYRSLKARLKPGEPVDCRVSGSRLGIGSNAIHFLDILAFLSGDGEFAVSAGGLDAETMPSKRPSHVEFTGTLTARALGGSSLVMRSFAGPGVPALILLESPSLRAAIREAEGRAWVAETRAGWRWSDEEFQTAPQSQLTHSVVRDLLERGDCALTPYEESARLHLAILGPLLEHMGAARGSVPEACPIT